MLSSLLLQVLCIKKTKLHPHSIASLTTPFMGRSGRPTVTWVTPRTKSQWDYIHHPQTKNNAPTRAYSIHQMEQSCRGKFISKLTNELYHYHS